MRQGEPPNQEDSGAFPPVRVFLVLMTVVIAIGAVVLLTREDDPPSPRPTATPSPNFALTDAEAIARFKELRHLHLRAYRQRDLSLLPLVFAPRSPIADTVGEEIRNLLRDKVTAKPRYVTLRLDVQTNTSSEISLIERANFQARFFDPRGNDITVGRDQEKQVIRWTLRPVETTWLISESEILRSEPSAAKS